MLYLIPSPIGNLDDFTYRAVKLIPTLDYLLCEDTRKTRILLNYYFPNQHFMTLPYHEINEKEKLPKVMEMLRMGLNLGLISNAGTPTIADPGYKLVRECRDKNIKVMALPGPSAIITALSASGLPTDRFCFIGYLPKKTNDLNNLLKLLTINKEQMGTIVAYESPLRLANSLTKLREFYGDIRIVVAREMTKFYETYYFDKISRVLQLLGNHIKGEITLVFNLNEKKRSK